MRKIELEEILKIINEEITKAQSGLANASTQFDQQYFIGKKHALRDIEDKIKYQHKHLLEAAG
jgi:hypothetical protein